MDKATIIELKNQSEAHCRELFDQLETLKGQITQVEVELERSRGDYRTYNKLVVEWEDPVPAEDLHLKDKPKKENTHV